MEIVKFKIVINWKRLVWLRHCEICNSFKRCERNKFLHTSKKRKCFGLFTLVQDRWWPTNGPLTIISNQVLWERSLVESIQLRNWIDSSVMGKKPHLRIFSSWRCEYSKTFFNIHLHLNWTKSDEYLVCSSHS